MQKVLYLSYDGMTDPLGQSQVLPYLSGLLNFGYKFTLISFEKKQSLEENYNSIRSTIESLGILWHPLSYTKKPPIISTMYDIYRMYINAKRACLEQNIEIVHCRSYISAIVGLRLKRKLGVKLIFDMRGFWADERVDGNIWNLKNPIYRVIYNYFKKEERRLLVEADRIISLTYAAKEEMISWGVISDPCKIEVIPCCVDDKLFVPGNNSEGLKKQLLIDNDDFIMSYLGSIGTWYLLEEMLLLFKKVSESRSNAKFLFVTADSKEHILDVAKTAGVESDKVLIVKAKRNEVPNYLKLSQVSVFFIKPLYSKKASSPTKLAEVLSMGIPVICNANVGDTEELIKKTKVGHVMPDFSMASYIEAVQSIEGLMKISPGKIRQVALDSFTLERGVKTYKSVYDSLIN